MAKGQLKVGDTARSLSDTLYIGSVVIDLTGATATCAFRQGETLVIQDTVAIAEPKTLGQVSCLIPTSVISVSGVWYQEWVISYSGGSKLKVPTEGFNELDIVSDLSIVAD